MSYNLDMTPWSKKWVGTGLLAGVLIFLAGMFGVLIRRHSGYNGPLWLPSGIQFSTLFLFGLEFWPFLLVGLICLHFWIGIHPVNCIVLPAFSIGFQWLGARYLRTHLSPRVSFSRLQVLSTFLIVTGIIIPVCDSIPKTILHAIFHDMPYVQNYFDIWRAWLFGEGLGITLVSTFAITLVNDWKYGVALLKKRGVEAIFVYGAITIACILMFTPLAEYNNSLIIKPYFLFSMMLWATVRFDLFGATTTSMIIGLTSLIGAYWGFVAFPSSVMNEQERRILIQYLIMAIALTGLIVATTMRAKNEALDARNEFLDIASHELKTPITSLKLQLELLQRKYKQVPELSSSETAQLAFVNKVDRQVNRLVNIVEQLLDVSRAERNIMHLEREEIVLEDLVQTVADRLASDVANARCALVLNIDKSLKGWWDPFRLDQVLENLISNAVKYAPGKAIEVAAELAAHQQVELRVKDLGPGIDPAKQHLIFDRFVRATETRHVQGLGLGLFITKKIIEAHGGSIGVESALGKGTTFIAKFPVGTRAAV